MNSVSEIKNFLRNSNKGSGKWSIFFKACLKTYKNDNIFDAFYKSNQPRSKLENEQDLAAVLECHSIPVISMCPSAEGLTFQWFSLCPFSWADRCSVHFVFFAGFSDQFDKYSWLTIDDLDKDYDYESIMHYDRKAFTKNGLPTIVNTFNEAMEFGTFDQKLSQKDIIEINALYDCISSK